MTKPKFITGELYHVFNRGVDKRDIFAVDNDIRRFYQSMTEFNSLDPIGSIYENSIRKKGIVGFVIPEHPLVNFVCYCLNPNHYHFILEQTEDRGVEKLMQRLSNGYTKFFNNKYKRSGSLFGGRYKAKFIDSNEYLLHLSAYINLNNQAHFGHSMSKICKSSWGEYLGKSKDNFCKREIILSQFKNKEEYKKFAEDSLETILNNKNKLKELDILCD